MLLIFTFVRCLVRMILSRAERCDDILKTEQGHQQQRRSTMTCKCNVGNEKRKKVVKSQLDEMHRVICCFVACSVGEHPESMRVENFLLIIDFTLEFVGIRKFN